MLSRTLVLKVASWSLVEHIVRKTFLFRSLVKRFVAGDTLDEVIPVCEDLVARGFFTTLDLLGENVKSVEAAVAAKNAYIEMLRRIGQSPCRPRTNISIKLTQCGFDQGDELTEAHYREVLDFAQAMDECFVRVDMESSAYTERTLRLVEKVWSDYKNTGTVLQSALYRTPQDAQQLIDLGIRVRLVKGAYLEPERVAYQDKSKVDEAFVDVAKKLMLEGNYPAIATHDEAIIDQLLAFAKERKIESERFEFQMLLGIRRDLQEKLREAGYHVRIYVPFGESWYPYFSRRLAERPANMFFILKSLLKG
ncbi:MAG: proline dehydrogenase family protein [Fimbriimonadaceae bacterium]|nr:proline dehydrogenase family protein [Fimbriimonadaceae bacterium]